MGVIIYLSTCNLKIRNHRTVMNLSISVKVTSMQKKRRSGDSRDKSYREFLLTDFILFLANQNNILFAITSYMLFWPLTLK